MLGDGWTTCAAGHRHWGLNGAAGLFLVVGGAVLLQHRSLRSHHGGTWGLPGGALADGETPLDGALREAHEETGIDTAVVRPATQYRDDHGGWSYVTVVASAAHQPDARPTNFESIELAWVPLDDVRDYALHPGFAATFPVVHDIAADIAARGFSG